MKKSHQIEIYEYKIKYPEGADFRNSVWVRKRTNGLFTLWVWFHVESPADGVDQSEQTCWHKNISTPEMFIAAFQDASDEFFYDFDGGIEDLAPVFLPKLAELDPIFAARVESCINEELRDA